MAGRRRLADPKPSLNWLINQTPLDGCLLVFNATWQSWRVRASDTEILQCLALDDPRPENKRQGKGRGFRDLYIAVKPELLEGENQ